jgi:hypothetical protein
MPHTQQLQHELRLLAARNRDGAFKTQANRLTILLMAATQLQQLGYAQLQVHELKLRHFQTLVRFWKQSKISDHTIRNRLAALRWWLEKIGRSHMVSQGNTYFQLAKRPTAALHNKAQVITEAQIQQIEDGWLQWSVRLQVAFGLRREEALLIRPWRADQGTHLWLKASWCKGGRSRTVPLLTPFQRDVLDGAKAFVPFRNASLIPPELNLAQQRARYDYYTHKAGLYNLHSARHQFAQRRLQDLSGHVAPIAGGPSRKAMSKEDRTADTAARLQVSQELGHNRVGITGMYVGL